MHQSSHRILRWTDDDRPYTKPSQSSMRSSKSLSKVSTSSRASSPRFEVTSNSRLEKYNDFQDLFCTLMVAVPLKTHRVRLQKKYHSFTTGDAIEHLGNLRFTQSNRRPSPTDPNITVTTKIATTFSMVPHMARYLCMKFLQARFIESVENKTEFNTADSVWQLTPKGINLLQTFAHRNGVGVQHVYDILDSPRNTMHLLTLERNADTDALVDDQGTLEVIFRRFAGLEGPNTKNSGSDPSSDSNPEPPNGIVGVKQANRRRVGNKVMEMNTFTGKSAIDWLMNCCTLVDEREANDIANMFMREGYIECVFDERGAASDNKFNPTRGGLYKLTDKGELTAKWQGRRKDLLTENPKATGAIKDSNTSRMHILLSTPSLRLLFREFLRDTHCEENLLFYMEVRDFLSKWASILRKAEGRPSLQDIRETLAGAYDLYNAYLAPGSPCELNIDHSLRNALVSRMTRFELPDTELQSNVVEVVQLYDQAQSSVFKLMASDSVPKFMRDAKYAQALQENHIETLPPNEMQP